MLLDIIDSYDEATKSSLRDVRQGMILALAKEHDPRKILSFLNKCAVIRIDEAEKIVHLGVPNEFVAQQVKKFFHKALNTAIHDSFNDQFSCKLTTYSALQQSDHALQLPVKTLLDITDKPEPVMDTSTKTRLESYFGILFESKYTLSNFVVGSANELAYSAAEAIINEPGAVYNPFFVYGNVGLGKTHLMQAIGNAIMDANPDMTVLYLPTTRFIDEVIKAIRNGKMQALQEKLDHIDVLMLDDVQFLAGKEKTQEIFHNIFNDFHSKQKQIVVTCDQPPKSLTLLEARLQSRFSLGMVADIKTPDLETRIAILGAKLKKKDGHLDNEHIQLIAETINTNVRELEGTLNIVLTKKKLKGGTLHTNDIIDSLATLGYDVLGTPIHTQHTKLQEVAAPPIHQSTFQNKTTTQTARLEHAIQHIAQHLGVAVQDVMGNSRKKDVSLARQLSMYIAKTQLGRSLQKIGNFFGGKNHASVIYAIKQVELKMQQDPDIHSIITHIL